MTPVEESMLNLPSPLPPVIEYWIPPVPPLADMVVTVLSTAASSAMETGLSAPSKVILLLRTLIFTRIRARWQSVFEF